MRKIVASFAASLDGYIEDAHGGYDWILIDPEIDFEKMFARFDTMFFGRKSYERFHEHARPGTKCFVFSSTLKDVKPGFELITEDIPSRVDTIRQLEGKDIFVFGGPSLLTSLLDLELVDEIEVNIVPVLLGQGKPMVEALHQRVSLDLIKHQVFSNGSVTFTYNVRK